MRIATAGEGISNFCLEELHTDCGAPPCAIYQATRVAFSEFLTLKKEMSMGGENGFSNGDIKRSAHDSIGRSHATWTLAPDRSKTSVRWFDKRAKTARDLSQIAPFCLSLTGSEQHPPHCERPD
jgi:hypothetical protein